MAKKRQQTVFDTGRQYLGSVYAKALLGVGQKADNAETLLEELDSVVEVLEQVPKLSATLESPRVSLEAKEKILDKAFGGKMVKQLLHFLKVLARRGRFDCLRAIAASARQQLNQMQDRVEVHVRSADVLDEKAIGEVANKLQARLGKQVDLHLAVEPDLIAGLVVRVGDTVYDGSLSNRLLRLRDEMVSKTAERISGGVDRIATSE